jgi:hypothetical protein
MPSRFSATITIHHDPSEFGGNRVQNPTPPEGPTTPPSRSRRGQARRRQRAERIYGALFVLTALVVAADLVLGGRLWHDILKVIHRLP